MGRIELTGTHAKKALASWPLACWLPPRSVRVGITSLVRLVKPREGPDSVHTGREMNTKLKKPIALALIGASTVIACAQSIQVSVNGQPITFSNGQPQMIEDRVMVPLRSVFHSLGASVQYEPTTQKVTVYTTGGRIAMLIGSPQANIDGRIVDMGIAPQVFGSTALVPLRFLSQSMGADVSWDPQLNSVTITTHPGRERGQPIHSTKKQASG